MKRILAVIAALLASPFGSAQDIPTQRLDVAVAERPALIENRIAGDQIIDYVITGEQSQILSVDMHTSNASANFNILPVGSETALFVGSTSGNVADIPLPVSGDYAVRVYMMRGAARRGEAADYSLAVGLGTPDFADGLAGGPDYWVVTGVGGGDSLNVRGGPATRYGVVSVVNNGDVLQNRGCRLSGDQRWCSIRATGSGVTGWVAGRYLRESAPPRVPEMPAGGPVGNGTPFDATSSVPCATVPGEPMRQCLLGVIRQGPGNAGVWMAIGNGAERYILFESGEPTYTDGSGALTFDKDVDLFRIAIGAERYEIPEAVVNGG